MDTDPDTHGADCCSLEVCCCTTGTECFVMDDCLSREFCHYLCLVSGCMLVELGSLRKMLSSSMIGISPVFWRDRHLLSCSNLMRLEVLGSDFFRSCLYSLDQ